MHVFVMLVMGLALWVSAASAATTYFSATHEGGNLNEWTASGGGIFCEPSCAVASTEQAHGGSWSAKMSHPGIDASDASIKMYRWSFPPGPGQGPDGGMSDGYFSSWFYFGSGFANGVIGDSFKNIFQFFTNRSGGGNLIGYLTVGLPPGGSGIRQVMYWADNYVLKKHPLTQTAPTFSTNPTSPAGAGLYTQATPILIPLNQWVQLEVYYHAARTGGIIRIWQDGQLIFDLSDANKTSGPSFNTLDTNCTANVTTVDCNAASPQNCPTNYCQSGQSQPNYYRDTQFSINNYGWYNADTVQETMYVDDVIVSSEQQSAGGGGPETVPAAPTNLRIVSP